MMIDGVVIDDDSDCYVIAELGHNHQGSVETAQKLIAEAAAAGASAVKLQKRDNRSLYTREMYDKPYDNENSFGSTYGEHREALEFGRAEYVELQACAREHGIALFATAFDVTSAEFLAELDMPAYKIASGDLRNLTLIRQVGQTGKPVIFSTGAAELEDVRRAYETLAEVNDQVGILQCTASYPASWDELDLRVIETYRSEFDRAVVGYSGHDNGISMPIVAYALGARILEKHFTLNRAMKGTDHPFSLEPQGLRKVVRDLTRARVALGDARKKMYPSELSALEKMGKKIVAVRDLPIGHVLSEHDVCVKSPGDGLPPTRLAELLGRPLLREVGADEDLLPEHVGMLPHDVVST